MTSPIPYTLKVSTRAHTMRIAVHPDGEVIVSVPRFVPQILVRRFVATHTEWIERHRSRAQLRKVVRVSRKEIPDLKKKALTFAEERCTFFAHKYGFSFKKITVRAQKSRWGSCSKSGNLSFNYKIALLPKPLADYIVVHEICHLGQMNHSKKFWDLVAREVPDYAKKRKELRQMLIVDSV